MSSTLFGNQRRDYIKLHMCVNQQKKIQHLGQQIIEQDIVKYLFTYIAVTSEI